jgi:hypothetical protein
MKLVVVRYLDDSNSTLGLLYVDGKFECYTLEDEKRDKKVMAETRIPEGDYNIKLRTEGGHHDKYTKQFPEHIGMLHVTNVPGFEWILIHIGNTEKDTAGCLLVGEDPNGMTIASSTNAYKKLYNKVAPVLKQGEKVTIKYVDIKSWIKEL